MYLDRNLKSFSHGYFSQLSKKCFCSINYLELLIDNISKNTCLCNLVLVFSWDLYESIIGLVRLASEIRIYFFFKNISYFFVYWIYVFFYQSFFRISVFYSKSLANRIRGNRSSLVTVYQFNFL